MQACLPGQIILLIRMVCTDAADPKPRHLEVIPVPGQMDETEALNATSDQPPEMMIGTVQCIQSSTVTCFLGCLAPDVLEAQQRQGAKSYETDLRAASILSC